MIKDLIEKSEPGANKAAAGLTPRRAIRRSGRISTWMRSIWRQRWLSLASAWVICTAGWTAIALWPSHYTSSALVYADLHRLAAETGQSQGEHSDERSDQGPVDLLKSVLLNDQGLADIRKDADLDERDAATLATDIMIRATAPTLFVASYDHSDPTIAHRVLEILFLNLTGQLELTASEDAAEFERETEDLENKLEIANKNLVEFEQENAELFDEASDETTDEDALQQELSVLQQEIETAIVERDEVAQRLAELPANQQETNDSEPATTLTDSEQNELALLETKLVELRDRYADSHPYVSTVLNAIDVIKAGEGGEGQSAPGSEDDNIEPVDDSLLSEQLLDLQRLHEEKIANVSRLSNEAANKQREIDRLSTLTDTTSSAEAERSRLTGEKNDLEAALAELVSRRDEAQQQAGSQQDANAEQSSFRLIDEPNLPEKPTGLSRLMGLALVLVGGLAIGGIAAVIRNRSKGVFESAWQLKQRFDVGVLGTISEVLTPTERKRLGYARLAFSLGCLGLFTVFGGLAIAEFLNLLTPWGDSLRTQLLG